MSDDPSLPRHDPDRLLDDMNKEYYAILDIASGYDQRLMTIKGWSVTLSLVALGLGFQQGHYALFALAAGTALGFWYLDAMTKTWQMKYYSRVRDIEIAALRLNNIELNNEGNPGTNKEAVKSSARTVLSAPRIDWSWGFKGKPDEPDWRDDPPERRTPEKIRQLLRRLPWRGAVALPHVVAVILGTALFIAALANVPGLSTMKP
jgi:hypothetical protein